MKGLRFKAFRHRGRNGGNMFITLWTLLAVCLTSMGFAKPAECGAWEQNENKITMTVLFDNYLHRKDCRSGWGFSCLIEGTEKTILFDTGTEPETLFHNVDRLKADLNKVEIIVISHDHQDHAGSLAALLSRKPKVRVYLPYSASNTLTERTRAAGAEVLKFKEPVEICRNVKLSGEMGTQIKEQALIIQTPRGLVVLTGCSHPGIIDILAQVKKISEGEINLVMGGFHLLQHSENQVERIVSQFRDLGVQRVGATHCTGDKAIDIFRKAYAPNFVELGVGRMIVVDSR